MRNDSAILQVLVLANFLDACWPMFGRSISKKILLQSKTSYDCNRKQIIIPIGKIFCRKEGGKEVGREGGKEGRKEASKQAINQGRKEGRNEAESGISGHLLR